MSSKVSTKQVAPCQTMRGHTDRVKCVVHLPGRRSIITCSFDGSIRLWDLESGAQIGNDWRDEGDRKTGVYKMALSPNGKTVVSGNIDGKVRLWNVETGKIVAKWIGHTEGVLSVCWSADGDRVGSGSWDRTARVWNVKSGETILEIKTGHNFVWAVIYSPDQTKIATGGYKESAVKIWDAKTGELLAIPCKHDYTAQLGYLTAATWKQISILEGHTTATWVSGISLSQNNRLLASASDDKTARLWNLDTSLQVGPSLQHRSKVQCAALSSDGNVLVTGCMDNNVYLWDVQAILKEANIKDQLPPGTDAAPKDRLEQKGEPRIEHTPRSSVSDKSFLEADATRCHDEFGGVDGLSPRFFDGMEADGDSSQTGGTHPHSSPSAFLTRLTSLLHRFRPHNAEATGLPQPPTPSILHPRVLLGHLSSLFHHSPPQNDETNEPQQPSTPSGLDLHALFARLSSLFPRSRLDEETEPRPTTPLSSRPDALVDLLSSLFRAQHRTSEELELPQRPMHPHVVEVPAMRDREVLYVAPQLPPHRPNTQPNGTITPGGRPAYPLPVRMLGHLGLLLCCVCHQHSDGNAHSTQQQGQSQGSAQTQVPSLQTQAPQTQTQPAVLVASISAVPAAPDTRTAPTHAATM
ncbi:WD40-repeat-containing domain protein [Suillus americanus]|nr:WD40-repeat-containing domain protein [Suillus americanus]